MRKVPATFNFEKSLWQQNKKFVVGIDEVGRGAWAGPLVAAAVIFPAGYNGGSQFFDSKLLNEQQREELSAIIEKEAFCLGIGRVEVEEITNLGLTKANQLAYHRALENLDYEPDHYLIDAFYIKSRLGKNQQTPIIRGDYVCASIAAASVIAKVFRDRLMRELAKDYSAYNFALNKGYGTRFHQEAIKKHGFSPIHRTSYKLSFLNG